MRARRAPVPTIESQTKTPTKFKGEEMSFIKVDVFLKMERYLRAGHGLDLGAEDNILRLATICGRTTCNGGLAMEPWLGFGKVDSEHVILSRDTGEKPVRILNKGLVLINRGLQHAYHLSRRQPSLRIPI
jgi:hypothetical protein